MKMTDELMRMISKERPVGTSSNFKINDYLERQLLDMGYKVESLPFECTVWEKDKSCLILGEKTFEVSASPFSEPFDGKGEIISVQSVDDLLNTDCTGKILLMSGELTQTPLQPKNYPFYYPEEHKRLIDLLEQKKLKAIIAATGKHPMCGLDPFPLFEDGNFMIPTAYLSLQTFDEIQALLSLQKTASLAIRSSKKKVQSRQLVAIKGTGSSTKKIVLCAHMDSKYGTDGTLDNAVGVAVLLETAKKLSAEDRDIEIVPFNGEEYYEASGELCYLKRLEERKEMPALLINFDSPCYAGSKNAVSFYNFNDKDKEAAVRLLAQYPDVVVGPEWYAGDHCAFIFGGTPCMAFTANDLFGGAVEYTHTSKDTLDIVSPELIEPTAKYAADFIEAFCKRK
jgi:aminopeptidase YwaD